MMIASESDDHWYDALAHAYYGPTADGRGEERWVGVTEALTAGGAIDKRFYKGGEALEHGRRVHRWSELHDAGASVDVPCPELDAYKRFRDEVDAEIVAMEAARWHTRLRYAGRVDRVLRLDGERGVLDIKTGGPSPWHAFQLSGYSLLWPDTTARWVLYLRPTGRYSLQRQRAALSDQQRFLRAVGDAWQARRAA